MCNKERHITKFRKIKLSKKIKGGGRHYYPSTAPYCRGCERVDGQARKLKTRFGITFDDYYRMEVNQNHRCAICGSHVQETIDDTKNTGVRLSIDHDHKTGKLRGLLCRQCNLGIGNLKDDTKLLHKAIEYLNKYS